MCQKKKEKRGNRDENAGKNTGKKYTGKKVNCCWCARSCRQGDRDGETKK